MSNKYFLTNEETKRIDFVKFIENLFSEYRHLYALNIFSYSTSVVKKGKIVATKPSVKIAIAFKYEEAYCYWFNGGASIHLNKEELFKNIDNFSAMKILTNISPINFYLKSKNSKVSYEEFQDSILKSNEFASDFIRSVVGNSSSILFCRDSIEEDEKNVLGKNLISKQNAILLEDALMSKTTKQVCVKI